MTQEFLYLADVGFAFEKMRRAGVPERVRRDVLFDIRILCRFRHDSHDVGGIEFAAASRRYEKADLSGFDGKAASRFFKIKFERGSRVFGERHKPRFVAFAVFDSHRSGLHLDIVD